MLEHGDFHGPKKQEAGLRLDSADGLRRGSDGGPVVTPGTPDDSPLIVAICSAGRDFRLTEVHGHVVEELLV